MGGTFFSSFTFSATATISGATAPSAWGIIFSEDNWSTEVNSGRASRPFNVLTMHSLHALWACLIVQTVKLKSDTKEPMSGAFLRRAPLGSGERLAGNLSREIPASNFF